MEARQIRRVDFDEATYISQGKRVEYEVWMILQRKCDEEKCELVHPQYPFDSRIKVTRFINENGHKAGVCGYIVKAYIWNDAYVEDSILIESRRYKPQSRSKKFVVK